MDKTTSRMAETISTLRFDDFSPEVIHETKRRLLDSVGCAAGAFQYPLSQTMRDLAGREKGLPPARVWFTGAESTLDAAGLANGTMVRYLDLSDTILSKAAGHPSDMIAALVALAETLEADGKTLITAIVAAYEAYGQLCDAVAFQKSGIDQSTAAALGAAAGASHLLNLDQEQTGQALSLALGANVNLYNVRQGALSDWKAIAGPNAARNGVFAAQMAAEGLSGPSAIFDGAYGLKHITGPFEFGSEGAQRLRILDTHLKAYPVCYHGQSAVDAAMALTGKFAPEDIQTVRIETYDAAFLVMGNDGSRWAPKNRETADHSIPYVVGTVFMTGNLRPSDYDEESLNSPALQDFLPKIEVRSSEAFSALYPGQARTRITVETRTGQIETSETLQPKGHVENPMSDEELVQKFDGLWPETFSDHGKSSILDRIWNIDTLDSVKILVDALCDYN
ncbi:MmgE/PrpD family protein [Celeribacter sp. PS-C1]|uniref:MmgE/PrpD family protein n=1 Tax=Celeribacter sp. PS-C1 TaxID=2820813 RepID=UPI001C67F3DD|nr:MmgE/PrpD family protein [Celeribacter sp. PS-C1]MBW6418523.1 MmgE/PrpD family protein [Celeribacter sp. PS-C1]